MPKKDQWQSRYIELVEYYNSNKTCKIPQGHPLQNWVNEQRRQYRNLQQGKKSVFANNKLRIQLLNELKFEWKVQTHSPKQKWDHRFKELCKYNEDYGNCIVKKPKNTTLYYWAHNQRKQCKYLLENKPSKLSTEKIQKLVSINAVPSQTEALGQLLKYTAETPSLSTTIPIPPADNTKQKIIEHDPTSIKLYSRSLRKFKKRDGNDNESIE